MTNSCAFYTTHTRLRVRRAPGFPCSLLGSFDAKLGQIPPRDRGCLTDVFRHCEERKRRSNPRRLARLDGLLRWPRPHGSRRRFAAPHHEGLRPHPRVTASPLSLEERAFARVSKDEATELENALGLFENRISFDERPSAQVGLKPMRNAPQWRPRTWIGDDRSFISTKLPPPISRR